MKELKYILLFEKFKSNKLSKTLGYTKDDSIFINMLKKVAGAYDFPISELSDDMFEYLPFKQALMFKGLEVSGGKKCEGESEWIPGEKCQGGKVKRTWGRGTRIVTCNDCGGTGFKKESSDKIINCIKFWFDSEGKLISKTGMDGTTKDSGGIFKGKDGKLYKELEKLRNNQVLGSNLKTGDIVKMNKNGGDYIGTIVKGRNGVYIIQNEFSGSSPNDYGDDAIDWKRYGRCSWALGGSDHVYITKLTPISSEAEADEIEEDPYSFNYKLEIGRSKLELQKEYDVEDLISDAHFALILNLNKLTTSEFKNVVTTRKERKDTKSGALRMKDDSLVRQENIERYIDKLSTKFNVAEGLSGVTKVLPRMLGGKNCIFYIYNGKQFNRFNSLIEYTYEFIKSNDAGSKKESAESIIDTLSSTFRNNINTDRFIEENKRSIMSNLVDDNIFPKHIIIVNEIEKLSIKINEKILKSDIQTIEDMEIVYSKIDNIRAIMKKNRYSLNALSGYFEYMTSSSYRSSYSYLTDLRKSIIDDIMGDIQLISNIVDKI